MLTSPWLRLEEYPRIGRRIWVAPSSGENWFCHDGLVRVYPFLIKPSIATRGQIRISVMTEDDGVMAGWAAILLTCLGGAWYGRRDVGPDGPWEFRDGKHHWGVRFELHSAPVGLAMEAADLDYEEETHASEHEDLDYKVWIRWEVRDA